MGVSGYGLVDDAILFNLFSGDGDWLGVEVTSDPDVIAFCAEAFEAVWARGIDHKEYAPG
jgi:hypothetical protein